MKSINQSMQANDNFRTFGFVCILLTSVALLWWAPTSQAMGFALYFIGWDNIGLSNVTAWPKIEAIYIVIAALSIGCVAIPAITRAPSKPRVLQKRIIYFLIALTASLVVPPAIGYSQAMLQTTFWTTDLPNESRTATHGRGVIISFGNNETPVYVVVPFDPHTGLFQPRHTWFINHNSATAQLTHTGHLRVE